LLKAGEVAHVNIQQQHSQRGVFKQESKREREDTSSSLTEHLEKAQAAHWLVPLMGLVNFCRCQTTPHEFFMILQLTDRKSIYTARGFSFGCWTGA
jgi:hypothetical protein